jgi:hypothetical protein
VVIFLGGHSAQYTFTPARLLHPAEKKLFIQQGTPFVHPAGAGLGGIVFLCNFAAEKIKET